MFARRLGGAGIVALALLLLMPRTVLGQTAGSITGSARDESGAVLPGVTVEAASPALIEKTRSAVTDAEGRYNILNLRPGVYVLTFQLPGFQTFRRQDIELRSGFTASIDATLVLGGIQETITVTSAVPVVDSVNTRQQRVVTSQAVETLPTGRTSTGFAQLIPGVRAIEGGVTLHDVGGLLGEGSKLVVHGSDERDTIWMLNGLPLRRNESNSSSTRPDMSAIAEVNFSVGANTAEHRSGGVIMNMITKEGGNAVSGTAFGFFSNSALQSTNLDDALRSRGLTSVNSLDQLSDAGFTIGGPIRRNKLWFFGSIRRLETDELIAGVFHDSNLQDFVYTPDPARPAHNLTQTRYQEVSLTWQASQKNKIAGYASYQPRYGFTGPDYIAGQQLFAPEASRPAKFKRNQYAQIKWTSPLTNRLLAEAGMTIYRDRVLLGALDSVPPNNYAIVDVGRNVAFNHPSLISSTNGDADTYTSAVSYLIGSHSFKAGLDVHRAQDPPTVTEASHSLTQTHLNGVPSSVTLYATPWFVHQKMLDVGIFFQDQWRIRRLTLNAGIRFDYHTEWVPAQVQVATRFLPARAYAEIDDVPNWKDVAPRLGVAYDLFGTGKTLVKGTASVYQVAAALQLARANNPVNASVNSATRPWTDLNQNFEPECDFSNPATNNECGPLSNLAFGTPRITTFYDSDVLHGTGKRLYDWETSLALQHELFEGVGLNVGYFRRSYGNFTATNNRAVTPADFDPFCITSPLDARLPGGGGQQMCGLYDVRPARYGMTDNLVTFAEQFGEQSQVYDGMDLSVSIRPRRSLFVEGGLNVGRVHTNNCFVVDSPEALRFCDIRPPFRPEIKFSGGYTFPHGIELSSSVISYPGPQITAAYPATNAQIAPSLGRDLSAGATATRTIELIQPGTMYDDRLFQLDLRASRIFRFGSRSVRGMVDLFNVFNANSVLSLSTGYGSNWLRPTSVVRARMVKFGIQVNY
jgi:hypothetical protein